MLLSCLEGLMEEMERYMGNNQTWHYHMVCVLHVYSCINKQYICANKLKTQKWFSLNIYIYIPHILSHISFTDLQRCFFFSPFSIPRPLPMFQLAAFAIELQGTLLKKDINRGLPTWEMRYEVPCATRSGEETVWPCLMLHSIFRSHILPFSGLTIRNIKAPLHLKMCFAY